MDDKAIRGILIEWLQANYPEGRIYQEKSIGESVCDVMLVSDCLTGFEIKTATAIAGCRVRWSIISSISTITIS